MYTGIVLGILGQRCLEAGGSVFMRSWGSWNARLTGMKVGIGTSNRDKEAKLRGWIAVRNWYVIGRCLSAGSICR